jgi:SNF2 family DNA or RNA helicase
MQQIANGFIRDQEGKVHLLMPWNKNPRVEAALEWLDMDPGKALTWCRFTTDIELLVEAAKHYKIPYATYYGATSDGERDDAVASFTDPEGIRWLIANPAAAGTGLNLQGACWRDLWYSNADKAIDRWQGEARLDRIGANGIITHTDLIAKGTPDRPILTRLKKKQGIAEMAIGDVTRMIEEMDV